MSVELLPTTRHCQNELHTEDPDTTDPPKQKDANDDRGRYLSLPGIEQTNNEQFH